MIPTNDQLLERVERYLTQIGFPDQPAKLYDPIGYSLSMGGKRLRPMLLLLSYGIFADDTEKALPAAAAVEVFHNFTLLHDDIMDNAAVRRGKPSVFARWGQNVAILSGDAMLISAYRLLAALPPQMLPRILERFNRMAIEVCEGQQLDIDFETRDEVSDAEYMRMIALKTSALLSGATELGAILGGAGAEDCDRLYRCATELGLAFQLQDDLLDSYGDQRLGKAIGGDILEGKKTYLMIAALARADEQERTLLRTIHTDPNLTDAQKIATVKALYDKLEVAELTRREIEHRFREALGVLDTLSVRSEATRRLGAYAGSLMGRNK